MISFLKSIKILFKTEEIGVGDNYENFSQLLDKESYIAHKIGKNFNLFETTTIDIYKEANDNK